MPKNWFFVVAVPEESRLKIAKMREKEDEILGNLKVMPKELSDELSRLVLVKLMPAFVEKDLKGFGEALTEFNQKLGRFWKDYQEGTYCNQSGRRRRQTHAAPKLMRMPNFLGTNVLLHSKRRERSKTPNRGVKAIFEQKRRRRSILH